jgi:non-lysosomal glucosylceramidase
MKRRPFLQLGSLAGLGFGLSPSRAFSAEDPAGVLYAKFVPADKQLPADWIASLTQRGHQLDAAIQYRRKDGNLDVIGMTVGGIGCGTVYLSGDGRLWVWDIFNQHHEGVVPNDKAAAPEGLKIIQTHKRPRERDGANFLLPPRAADHLNGVDARFILRHAGKDFPLDASGWEDVTFTGRWPVGTVDYGSGSTPLKVRLNAFSPFIPLDLKSSSLPVTVMEYTIENPTTEAVEATLTGHLNNPAGQFSKLESARYTEKIEPNGVIGLLHGLRGDAAEIRDAPDSGTMAIGLLGAKTAVVRDHAVGTSATIPAGGSVTIRFAIAWHFPNLSPKIQVKDVKRHYANDFASAREVLAFFAMHQERLCGLTRQWVATWNDSTLPQWLLDRTILTANTLQTQCSLIFDNGRFWAWEGIGCCPGTCGHVWQYAQGHARLFPEIERNLREVTDYGLAQNPDGSIRFRGSNSTMTAIDSQASYILRTLRDHQLADHPEYLNRVWPATRKALQYLIDFDAKDGRGGLDGLLDGMQHNTLDAEWYGKVHVLCSMYLASLRAGEELALRVGDKDFAKTVRGIYEKGAENIASLFNGEFYEQQEDPDHLDKIGVGKGCYIDQVMGQFWANQVGLGRLYNAGHQKSALRALWKYNFVPEYGAFRQEFREGRHYAIAGDSGLLMCTWPKGGLRPDFKKHWQYAYFNEFMTGFEYQAAAHMIAERDADLVQHGLAVTRAIHDRYSATRGRNPYNEIECSDHYARAGSSYAVFLALCGFHFDQATGLLRFDPVIQQDHFKAPFTTSAAWGTFEQTKQGASIKLTHGKLDLQSVELPAFAGKSLRMTLNGGPAPDGGIQLAAGDLLEWRV